MYYMKSTFVPHTNHYPLKSPMLNSKNLQLLQIGPMLFNAALLLTISGGIRTTLIRDCQSCRTSTLLINLLGILTRRNEVLPSLTNLVKNRRRFGLSNARMAKERRRLKPMRSHSLMQSLEKKKPSIPLNVLQIILKM